MPFVLADEGQRALLDPQRFAVGGAFDGKQKLRIVALGIVRFPPQGRIGQGVGAVVGIPRDSGHGNT